MHFSSISNVCYVDTATGGLLLQSLHNICSTGQHDHLWDLDLANDEFSQWHLGMAAAIWWQQEVHCTV
jgi:hypothetical protein